MIGSNYGQTYIKKEVKSPPRDSAAGAAVEVPRGSPKLRTSDAAAGGAASSAMEDVNPVIQQNVMHEELRKQHELQQEMLRKQYEDQKQQLEQQLQFHISYLEQKKQKADEERIEKQRQDQERIEAIKNKGKDGYSAVASHEVKQRLQEMILRKNQGNSASTSSAGQSGSASRNWVASCSNSGGRSLDRVSPPQNKPASGGATPCCTSSSTTCPSTSSHPYRPQGHIHGVNEDFPPLRKTASEPNIVLKVRLKQRVNERRSSPLVSRKDRIHGHSRRRPLAHVDSASTPDSGQNSPPNGLPASRSSSGSTPIHEEAGSGSPYGPINQGGSCSDLTHPFTSLPNISLGRPPHSTHGEGMKLAMVSETEMVSAAKAGIPLTGHLLPSTLPNYPALPVIESSEATASATSSVCSRLAMEATGTNPPSPLIGNMYTVGVVPGHVEAQARFRTLQRPLGRTHSAPLPLGHVMLGGAPPTFLSHVHPGPSNLHQYEHKLDHHPHSLIKQQIRDTVMKRTSSKNHVENVEEETEAAVARAIGADKLPEVIDLTDKKMEVGSENSRLYWGAGTSAVGVTNAASAVLYHHDRGIPLISYQRDLLSPKTAYSGTIVGPRSGSHLARPLTRAQSSPSVTLPAACSPQEPMCINKQGATTGLAYDSLMKKHQCICGEVAHHPEHGGRIQAIWNRLQDTGLTQRCNRVRSRKASPEEIQSCHSEAHTAFFGTYPLESNRPHFDIRKLGDVPIKNFVRLQCGGIGVDSDTTWNNLHTSSAARMAVGCVLELAFKVACGELRNGFAIVRPPGHHAEYQQAMGFCFFNNISIAAKQLQEKFHYDKILILDWDVHHGNGTQSFFYEDPHILYLSLHRYDDGSFFPGTGGPNEVGEGDGYGFNVNIAWSGGINPPMGDAEYLAAFRSVVMPIAKDFDPDIILVSAGFDAAEGHPPPLGGYLVSPSCFAYMTRELMRLSKGKVVLALEGGYSVDVICDCSHACIQALLDDEIPPISEQELTRRPSASAVETLQNVIAIQTIHWPVVRKGSPLVALSALEAQGREEEQETVSAMASLRVDQHGGSHNTSPEPVCESPCTGTNCINISINDQEEPMEEDIDSK